MSEPKKRYVVVEVRVPVVIDTYADTPDMVEFMLNESSSCTSNLLRQLVANIEACEGAGERSPDGMSRRGPCYCNVTHARHVRDATPEEAAAGYCLDESAVDRSASPSRPGA